MYRITVNTWMNISAGQSVPSGYDYDLTAPSNEGMYTLYEIVDENHCHVGWQWEKEEV